jgi:hypothetical protein
MRLSLCALALLTLVPDVARASAQQGPAQERTTREAVFSLVQAERGAAVFSRVCSECHTRDQFKGSGGFQKNWEGRTFFDVFEQLRSTMPNSDPGSLPRREYIDVLIYLLRECGHPAGAVDLEATDASLKAVRIVTPGGGPQPEAQRRAARLLHAVR